MPSRRLNILLGALLGIGAAVARADSASIGVADKSAMQPANYSAVPRGFEFTLSRSGDLSYAVVVRYETADVTAHDRYEYRAASGVSIIEPGASTGIVFVEVLRGAIKTAKTFELNLLSALGVGPEPTFAEAQSFATGDDPRAVAFADVNGDGKPDLITVNRAADTLSILLNATAAGAATPSFATQQAVATGDVPASVAVTDLNADGRPDVVVGYQNSSGLISVLLNATTPGSDTVALVAQTFAAGNTPWSVAAADVNGDGLPDVVVANQGDDTVSVLLNTTAAAAAPATFSPQQTFATGDLPLAVAAIDVNSDGRPDLAVANRYNTVSVLLNTTAAGAGTASFNAQQTYFTLYFPDSLTTGDINQDGLDDLIVAGDSVVSIHLNATSPGADTASFRRQEWWGPNFLAWAEVADVNGDGRPEVLFSVPNLNTVGIFRSRTAPAADVADFFSPTTSYAVGAAPAAVAAADLNADGKADVISPNSTGDSVSVLLNTVPDSAFTTDYQASLSDAQAIGTILPHEQVAHQGGGGIGGRALLLLLLGVATCRCRTARKSG